MINLLNLTDAEDIYSLMADLAEDAHGGDAETCARRQLDTMEPYRPEICKWARSADDVLARQAALSYLWKMAELCRQLGDEEREFRLYSEAKHFARDILAENDDLEAFLQLCQLSYRQLAIYWEREQEFPGKTTCNYLLRLARTLYAAHPEWNRQRCLEELARIYDLHAKWYGMYCNEGDRNGAWHVLCRVRAGKIRLYLNRLQSRDELVTLRQNLFDAAERYMDVYWDWDLKQARGCLLQALNLMKRNPKLPNTNYLTAAAYERIARTYEEEEEYARIKQLEFPEQKRIACREKAKEYRIREMNAWMHFLAYRQRRGLDTDVARMCLRDCYEGLAEDFSCLPGEKNAAKAKKYRQKAEDLD